VRLSSTSPAWSARRPPPTARKLFPPDLFIFIFIFYFLLLLFLLFVHKVTQIAGMTAGFDRRLARFERVSPLTLLMMISADLGIAMVI
jgi:hypothetical protein